MGDVGYGIGEVSARTGIAVPVLRMWESRFGFPVPERSEGGRRRYSDADIEALLQVVRDREAGTSLKAAIERAGIAAAATPASIFAGLRRARQDLPAYLFSKRTLTRMSHAIEDEFCARSEPAALLASFQHERHYRGRSEARWRDLARTAEAAFVFADFDRVRRPKNGPIEVPLDPDDPLAREWSVICDGRTYGICMAGWERPGQNGTPDPHRRFETIWSIEPRAVRDGTRIGVEIVHRAAPELVEAFPARVREASAPGAADLRALADLTSRMIGYTEPSADPR